VGKIIHLTNFHPFEQAFHLSERFVILLDESYQSVFGRMIIAMAHRIWSVWCRALKCLIHYTLVKGFSVVFPPIAIYCLLVFSYFFFVSVQFLYCSCARAAADMGSPIATLNIGPTRADDLALFKVSARSGEGSAHSRLLHVFEWFLKHGFCLLVRNSYAVMYFRYCLGSWIWAM
jgi:hypothetical protein